MLVLKQFHQKSEMRMTNRGPMKLSWDIADEIRGFFSFLNIKSATDIEVLAKAEISLKNTGNLKPLGRRHASIPAVTTALF